MSRFARHAAFAVLASALALSGCAREEEPSGAPPPAATGTTTVEAPPQPPLRPLATIRVVDGDTGEPVPGARVTAARYVAPTNRRGVVRFRLPPRALTVRVSARGYGPEAVRVRSPKRLAHTITVWNPDTQWTLYGATRARTQAHPAIDLRPPFRVVWRRRLGSLLEFPAVVWHGVAYVNTIRGWLFALSVKTGRVLWKNQVGTRVASSPGLDPERGVLVTPTMSPGYVAVASMKTGRVRWRYYTGRTEPSPVVRDGVAYFGAENGNVYALDLDRRRPRWTYHGGVKITSSPALVGDRLYFGDYAGRVTALHARTGRVVWTGSAGSRVYGTVAVARGRVFAPSVFSGLTALSARTGRTLWRIPSGVYVYSSPAVFRGRVYFGTYAGAVHAADARSGRILWTRFAGGAVSGAVQVVGNVVYAASFGNRTTAWHWRSGRELWQFPHGRYVPVSGNAGHLLMHGGSKMWGVVSKGKKRKKGN